MRKGLPKAKCINCVKVYMARKNCGTSNMKNHALKEEGMYLLITIGPRKV
jgi:hypothetical protein